MKTAYLSVIGLSFLLSTSAFAGAWPPTDTVITKTFSAGRITRMKVIGNIDLIFIKSDTEKAEIKMPATLAPNE